MNQKKIELAEKAGKNLLELDSEKASAIARLKGDLKIFKRQRGRYYIQLTDIKSQAILDTYLTDEKFKEIGHIYY